METPKSLPELVEAARADAKTISDRVSEIQNQADGHAISNSQAEELHAAIVALETSTIDIFSIFEARMQHHFKRGPFSRKLKTLLLNAGETDLASRVYQYYLATNVLKHGKGASYRELVGDPDTFIVVKSFEDTEANEDSTPSGLIDVSVVGFFDGLTTTILDAFSFLESR